MAKKNNTKIIIIFVIYLIILFIWWTIKGTLPALIISTISYLIILLIINLASKKINTESNIKTKSEKPVLIDKKLATEIMNNDLRENEMIVPYEEKEFIEKIIKPEDPSQSPTFFWVRQFRDRFDDKLYLQYINRETSDITIKKINEEYNDKKIMELLKDSSKSTREYEPTIKQYTDEFGKAVLETSYRRTPIIQEVSKKGIKDEVVID